MLDRRAWRSFCSNDDVVLPTDCRTSPLGLDYLARTDALGASSDRLDFSIDDGSHPLEVGPDGSFCDSGDPFAHSAFFLGQPPAGDLVSGSGAFTADIADFGHLNQPLCSMVTC